MAKIAALFPGQGSQSVGMGKDFFETDERARERFVSADKVLGYPLSKLCFEGPRENLTLTANAQPALLTAGYIAFELAGIDVAAAAGHSLGEYTALVAAGVLSFEDAVQLVHKRGKYMQEAVPAGTGKMLAVMGPNEEEIAKRIRAVSTGTVEIANLNCPGQTVVAGDNEGLDAFAAGLGATAKLIPLNVSAPFHCRLMQPAAEALARDLDAIRFQDPKFPIYANVTAAIVRTGEQARELLKQQVCATVRWTDSMQNMIAEQAITLAVEFGPGGVLSKLLKRIGDAVARTEIFDSPSLKRARVVLGESLPVHD